MRVSYLCVSSPPQLLQWFKPRLVLSGHTHSGCEVVHDNKYPEVSVPSFSWRNRNNPSFILVSTRTRPAPFSNSSIAPSFTRECQAHAVIALWKDSTFVVKADSATGNRHLRFLANEMQQDIESIRYKHKSLEDGALRWRYIVWFSFSSFLIHASSSGTHFCLSFQFPNQRVTFLLQLYALIVHSQQSASLMFH